MAIYSMYGPNWNFTCEMKTYGKSIYSKSYIMCGDYIHVYL